MKLTKRIDYRVVVSVPDHRWIDTKRTQESHERLMRDACQEVVDGIKRHLDLAENPTIESTEACRFCGYPWESALDEEGKPACCGKALSEWQALQPESQQFGAGA